MLKSWHLLCASTQRSLTTSRKAIFQMHSCSGNTHSLSLSSKGTASSKTHLSDGRPCFSMTTTPVTSFNLTVLGNTNQANKQQQRFQEVKLSPGQLGVGIIRHLRGHLGETGPFVHILFQCRCSEPEVIQTRSYWVAGVMCGVKRKYQVVQ